MKQDRSSDNEVARDKKKAAIEQRASKFAREGRRAVVEHVFDKKATWRKAKRVSASISRWEYPQTYWAINIMNNDGEGCKRFLAWEVFSCESIYIQRRHSAQAWIVEKNQPTDKDQQTKTTPSASSSWSSEPMKRKIVGGNSLWWQWGVCTSLFGICTNSCKTIGHHWLLKRERLHWCAEEG